VVASDLLRLAETLGQPASLHGPVDDAPEKVTYAPELLPLQDDEREEALATAKLPILLYHRIARAAADPRTVTPDALERQLAALVERGYRGVHLDDWLSAQRRGAPLDGRCVGVTFDHGYRDFLDHAWPSLERFGFPVTLFVVTDAVGGKAGPWSAADGAPLLSWDELAFLRGRGVRVGSASASHRVLTGATSELVAREAVSSRLALETRLGAPARAFAYPFGAEDEVVQHIVGACGYACGLTRRRGRAGLWDSPLSLPRIEVRGDMDLHTFLDAVESR
jgi:peptidoglycan/xylan/chitin deacetylase (PgdA/CDA1 family)